MVHTISCLSPPSGTVEVGLQTALFVVDFWFFWFFGLEYRQYPAGIYSFFPGFVSLLCTLLNTGRCASMEVTVI
jgi:hypothetical protein